MSSGALSRSCVKASRHLLLCQRQSTLASVSGCRFGRLQASRPVLFMGTWTDRVRRWQSGPKTGKEGAVKSDGNNADDVPVSSPEAAKYELMVKEKVDQLEKQQERYTELQDKYMRALAETENVRQRMSKQVEEAKRFGIQGFSRDLLEVADLLEKANQSVVETELKDNKNPPLISLLQGLKMTESELQKVFTKHGLEKIEALGKEFDPAFHEALFEMTGGGEPGTVGMVSRLGYSLAGRTIRPARVGVVKAPPTEPADKP